MRMVLVLFGPVVIITELYFSIIKVPSFDIKKLNKILKLLHMQLQLVCFQYFSEQFLSSAQYVHMLMH